MKCIFIYNPASGRGQIMNHIEQISNALATVYDVVDTYASKSSKDVTAATIKACSEYDAIIFSGGDGTFNEVAMGVSSCERRPPLGYIPLGTTNDIARNLKIPRNVKGALKVILTGKTIKHDVGKINDRYFVYSAAIGACTGTSYTTKHEEKKLFGRLAYVRNGMNEFFTTPLSKVRVLSSDKSIETTAPLVLVLNSISVGGMPFNRYGHLNDGLFDVILVNNDISNGRLNIIRVFLPSILGKRRKEVAIALHASNFRMEIDGEQTWCIYGEEGPKGSVNIENLHNHLTIYAPKRKARRQKNR
jgi:diacylglycerol kinase (ATP)